MSIKDKNIRCDKYIDKFCEYIKSISMFINYLKFKNIFNLYIKIDLKVYEMIILIRFEKNIKIYFL